MPDPTYKTFLSPGSCQLEITDLVAAANDDTGVDLYGVAWEIEQVLIAGEGFAASPTDVWVNERGILNIGQSLFDKINRTALNNTNIPGQCTVIVKATSLVDSSKVARLKVLVGYPGEGGGGGGGGSVDVGNLVAVWAQKDVPVANAELGEDANIIINTVSLTPYASPTVVASNDHSVMAMAAAGTFVRTFDEIPYVEENPACYDVVINYESYVFTSVTQLENVNITATTNIVDDQHYTYEIEVPALELGHALLVVAEALQ